MWVGSLVRVWRDGRVGGLVGLVLAGVAAGCGFGGGDGPIPGQVSWRQVSTERFVDRVSTAVYLSKDANQESNSGVNAVVAFTMTDGSTRFLRTGRLDNGGIVQNNRGQLAFWTASKTYVIAGNNSRIINRHDKQITGHWFSSLSDGDFVSVFNAPDSNDSITTEVYTNDTKGITGHGGSALTPDLVGMTDQKLWLGSLGDAPDITEDLSEVPLHDKAGTEHYVTQIKYWGSSHGWETSPTGPYVAASGKLWWLEIMVPAETRSGGRVEHAGGAQMMLRLASVDPSTKTYASTHLGTSTLDWQSVYGLVRYPIGEFEGSICWIDDLTGQIKASRLDHPKERVIAKLAGPAADYGASSIVWGDHHVDVLVQDEDKRRVWVQSYDLSTGKLTTSRKLTGLSSFWKRHPNLAIYQPFVHRQ